MFMDFLLFNRNYAKHREYTNPAANYGEYTNPATKQSCSYTRRIKLILQLNVDNILILQLNTENKLNSAAKHGE